MPCDTPFNIDTTLERFPAMPNALVAHDTHRFDGVFAVVIESLIEIVVVKVEYRVNDRNGWWGCNPFASLSISSVVEELKIRTFQAGPGLFATVHVDAPRNAPHREHLLQPW